MPQLDLATYSLHIICFSGLYTLLYLYLRGSLLLNISSLFKYRIKVLEYFVSQKDFFFSKFILFSSFLDIKIKTIINLYLNFILNYFLIINYFFFY